MYCRVSPVGLIGVAVSTSMGTVFAHGRFFCFPLGASYRALGLSEVFDLGLGVIRKSNSEHILLMKFSPKTNGCGRTMTFLL